MPTVADYLRAVNAPPVLGDLSAATTQPWLVPGVGTGPGAQLIMKDPAGVAAAALAQSQAAGVANPYAGKVWGDTIGQAQGNVLNMRAQDLNAAAQAAARAQQAQQFQAQQQRLDSAARAQAQAVAQWHQADTAQRTRNDTLDFLSSLAKMTGSGGGAGTGRAAAADALETYNQTRENLGASLTNVRDAIAELPNLREQFTYTDPEGRKTLGVSEDVANAMRMIGGWAPDSDTVQNALVGAHASLKRDEYGIKEALNTARNQYQQQLAQLRAQPSPGMSTETLGMLLQAAGLGGGSKVPLNAPKPLLVPGWNGSAANDPRYRRVKVEYNAPGTYGPQTVQEALGFTPTGPIDVPTYDRTFSVDAPSAPVTRMQMLPDGSLVPAPLPYLPGTVADFRPDGPDAPVPYLPGTVADFRPDAPMESSPTPTDSPRLPRPMGTVNVLQGILDLVNSPGLPRPTGTVNVLQGIQDLINSPGLPRPTGTVNVLAGLPSVIPVPPRTRSPDAIDALLSVLTSPGKSRPTGTVDVFAGLRELFRERPRPTGTVDVLQGLRELFRERPRPTGTVNVLSAFQ